MQSIARIDAALSRAVETKEVPGVVAMAATDTGTIYEGAFGLRDRGDRRDRKRAPPRRSDARPDRHPNRLVVVADLLDERRRPRPVRSPKLGVDGVGEQVKPAWIRRGRDGLHGRRRLSRNSL